MADTTDKIRNVVFLSHSGAGKTSLLEAMLFNCGVISRLGAVEKGTTMSDYEPEEARRRMTLKLSLLPCTWQGTKQNLIDTPGYPELVGEVKSGLRVSDGAVVVICGASGVQVDTERAWKYVGEVGMPQVVVVNKMDRDNADFFKALEQTRAFVGTKCLPLCLPIGSQQDFQGIVDLLSDKAYLGNQAKEADPPESMKDEVKAHREKLVEAIVETNDELLNRYLEGGEIDRKELHACLRQAVISGRLVPVLATSAVSGIGVNSVLRTIADCLPSPLDVGKVKAAGSDGKELEIAPGTGGPLAALVFKTAVDPYVGKLNYFRVYSGVLSSNSQIWNATKGSVERVGQLYMLRGKTQEPVPEVAGGDIGAVAKLAATGTGDSLSARDTPVALDPVKFPRPIFSMAVNPKSKADLEKMSLVLPRICEEDPTLQVVRDPETSEFLLQGFGEVHLEVAVEKLVRKFGVEVELASPKIAYRETVARTVTAEYKHKKQTGGHGQYGHVVIQVEPLPRGSGFEFAEKVVGGAVPKNYVPAVEKGVNEGKQEGVLAGYPLSDLRVTLVDGSYHEVDSSEISFKIAAVQALKKGLSDAQPVLLEPIVTLVVRVPENYTGDIISDLNTKRGRILGMDREGNTSIIRAQVPLEEVSRYAGDLRSLTQGRGDYSFEFSHYEEVPAHITQKIVEKRSAAAAR